MSRFPLSGRPGRCSPERSAGSRTFLALCAFAGLLGLVVVVRARDAQRRRIDRSKHDARLAEQERLARELHDTLLQSTQGLVLKFQAVTSRIDLDDPSRAFLADALAEADKVMIEGRDRIENLGREAPLPDRLGAVFGALGRKLSAEHGTTFALVVRGTPRALRPLVVDEAHRVGSEALLNAFQHARASGIEIELTYARTGFRLRVRDDGVGIDGDVLQRGHAPNRWGLRGMRERAQRVGASLEVTSAAGAGTDIAFVVAAPIAYAASGTGDRALLASLR